MSTSLLFHLDQLEKFRSYLTLLARIHLDSRLQGKLSASDVVQDVMIKAIAAAEQFRGTTEAELAGWLRRMLVNHLMNLLRDFRSEKRDLIREQHLDQAVDASSVRLESWLAVEQSTPSVQAVLNEELLLMAEAIMRLPDAQREVITLYHLAGWSVVAIGERMGRSREAVAGLIKRGLRQLREDMRPQTENTPSGTV